MKTLRLAALLSIALVACQSPEPRPLPLAGNVDLQRFMGRWYVIAATPTFIDAQAHGAIETYRLAGDGSIETTYEFHHGGFDGPLRTYRPRGFVRGGSGNAVWGMRFVWPVEADYRIGWLAPDYGQVIVAREARDHAWIMARTPTISPGDYAARLRWLADAGYDTSKLRRIPQVAQP